MCGIVGWIGGPVDELALQTMTNAIRHRGPDGEGTVALPLDNQSFVALGHRRLSIIDLGAGDQPMRSHDDRFTIVFNGEIYNYIELRDELQAKGAVFRTHSDTEVIIEGWRFWGMDCLNRFRGMFAFALYDEKDRSVVLARDPFGKKPVYYATHPSQAGESIVFASEIGALLSHPAVSAELDVESLHDYLCWRYVPGPNTFFKGIRKLVPGGLIHWSNGVWEEKRYWLPPEEQGAPRGAAPKDPIGEFLEVFDEAVRLRLRADVPLGAFLSGGLDSTSIVATLAHLGAPEIRTFSVGFEGDSAAELPLAAETARLIGTIHTPVVLNTDKLAGHLPMLSRLRGAPMAETADLPIYLMSLEAAKHVKVVLSGEGADELFGGYPKHVAEHYLGRFAPSGLLSVAARAALAGSSILPGTARRLTISARALKERSFEERMVRWFGAITTEERKRLWTGPRADRAWPPIPFNAPRDAAPLRRVLQFDQTSWLPDNLLERMDSMTMAASIEGRAPFMDVKLAEFASRLPLEWRIKGMTTKRIVREALGPRLPEAVINRPKNGFRMPVSAWFRGDLRAPFRDLLLGNDAVTRDYLDRREVMKIADEHAGGKKDHAKTLWGLYALETFLREFF
ncbi:MAG: asparagine synthase (glutamine-hydrolyzing) [Paracoccaceae bacterium]